MPFVKAEQSKCDDRLFHLLPSKQTCISGDQVFSSSFGAYWHLLIIAKFYFHGSQPMQMTDEDKYERKNLNKKDDEDDIFHPHLSERGAAGFKAF